MRALARPVIPGRMSRRGRTPPRGSDPNGHAATPSDSESESSKSFNAQTASRSHSQRVRPVHGPLSKSDPPHSPEGIVSMKGPKYDLSFTVVHRGLPGPYLGHPSGRASGSHVEDSAKQPR